MTNASSVASKAASSDSYEFMPAALEISEAPPAPFGRIIALTIATFFVIAVAWACWGTIDVVAITQGQTVPTGRVKTLQPLETGVIRAIHIEEGDHVDAGQIVLELDPTDALANVESLEFDLVQAQLDAAVAIGLLGEVVPEKIELPANIDPILTQSTRWLLEDRLKKHHAAQSGIESEILRLAATDRAAQIELTKIADTLPLIQERLSAQEMLLERGITQKPLVLSLRQEMIERQAALASTIERQSEVAATIASLEQRQIELHSTFRAEAAQQHRDALRRISTTEQSLLKERQRREYSQLRAPVSGIVNQLAVSTIGAVVGTGDQLLTIVPDDTPLQVEAMLLNKDIGFVEEGDKAELKLEAFPFTRYGTVHGTLKSISEDAIIHEQFGPVYKAVVALDRQHIVVEGRKISLSPGMNLTAEIKTGKRRIIEFFLSPLLRYKDEAIRER